MQSPLELPNVVAPVILAEHTSSRTCSQTTFKGWIKYRLLSCLFCLSYIQKASMAWPLSSILSYVLVSLERYNCT
jgi:hypothetical protein